MNNDFHQFQNYQKINEYQFINNMFFGVKKKETIKIDDTSSKDLELVTKMNQEFAMSLDLKETLNNSLELIIKRINAQAANIFLIDKKNQSFQCIASKHQAYLEDFEIPITQGVMGKAAVMKKCIRVGDVRKDIREIAEFYFDLDNKTNFTTYSVLCSPLIAANECIGVIHCLNKKTNNKLFEENDRKLLETLSGPAALAINNAKFIVCNTRDKDLGTIFEAGFSYGNGTPIIYYAAGLKGNFNLMLSRSGRAVATNVRELKKHIKGFLADPEYREDYVGNIE